MSVIALLQTNPVLALAVSAVLGLLVGSFLNVVIHRLPLMLERDWRRQCAEFEADPHALENAADEPFNLLVPRSRCPGCGHGISVLENIPVVSYLALRGRCSACGMSISSRYPVIEALAGALSVVVVWHFGVNLAAIGALFLTWALVAVSVIDIDRQLLPDAITLPMLWLGLLLNSWGVLVPLHDAVLGAAAGYMTLWLVFHGFKVVTGKEGMGHGDFKLLAMLGGWLGWQAIPGVILLSSLAGAVVGLSLIALRRHERSTPIPFGPYLAAAGWISLLWGSDLAEAYLSFVGLT